MQILGKLFSRQRLKSEGVAVKDYIEYVLVGGIRLIHKKCDTGDKG
jgi:hypothetical protein